MCNKQLLITLHLIGTYFVPIISGTSGKWTLPTPDKGMAIGIYYSHSHLGFASWIIHIIGGHTAPDNILLFSADSYNSTDESPFQLQETASTNIAIGEMHSQSYTQMNNTIYFLGSPSVAFNYSSHIMSYNLATRSVSNGISLPVAISPNQSTTCLTSFNDEYLFLIKSSGYVYIYTIPDQEWSTQSTSPQTITQRESCACAAASDNLYVIGGDGINTVEKMNISELKEFIYLTQNVSELPFTRAVVYDLTQIYVIGGPDIFVIDTISDRIFHAVNKLNPVVIQPAVITHPLENILYVFGGYYPPTGPVNAFQYFKLPMELEGNDTYPPTMETSLDLMEFMSSTSDYNQTEISHGGYSLPVYVYVIIIGILVAVVLVVFWVRERKRRLAVAYSPVSDQGVDPEP